MRGNARIFTAGLLSAGLSSALALGAVPAGATARPAAGSRAAGSAVPVIVFLKKQPAAAGNRVRPGERTALIQAAQAPYLDQLRQLGATGVHSYRLADAFAARVPAAAIGQLAASPGVAAVIPDSPIVGPSPVTAGPAAAPAGVSYPGPGSRTATARGPARQTTVRALPGGCPANPVLTPEGLGLTHTDWTTPGQQTARSLGFTGAGVKVAFLADGIDPSNPNLTRGGKSVISAYKDFSGDGTAAPTGGGEAFIDANAVAGQGSTVYSVAGFGAQSPSVPCKIRIEGVAPGASLVALKVFSKNNISTTSGFLQAIDYAVNVQHVNVLNESFGANPFPDVTSLDAVKEFNDMAVAAGVTVVVAAGDAGSFNTIGSPASDPRVISVGASTDFRFYAQTNYAGADQFASSGWENDNISALSSGGFTQDGRTLDLVAPGDLSFASCTPNVSRYSDCVNFLGDASPIEQSGGTSEAAPEVAGAAALVIQAYRKMNGGAVPSPAQVKQILLSTATDLGAPATEQGAGLLNSLKAVELASWMAHCDPVGTTLRLSSNQLNYVGRPGTTASWPVTVTNTSAKPRLVRVSGRALSAESVIAKASVTLSDTTSPHFTNWAGVASSYGEVHFTVGPRQSVLNTSIAWPARATDAARLSRRVRLILIDPAGRLAANSLPQGVSGYGTAQVLRPAAGRWTAVISSDTGKSGGTTGRVLFGAAVAHYQPFGTMSPSSLRLAPGASRTVTVSARVPNGGGDSTGAVIVTEGPGTGDVTVPVTLRGQLTAALGAGTTFSGELTGGNGRAPGEGQVAAYSFIVPAHLPVLVRDIDADVTLRNDPGNQVSAYLVAPGGQTMGYGSNYLTTGFTSKAVPVESPRQQLSVYTSNPIPGVWTLIIDFTSPVPGNELADPFTGRIRLNSVRFSRGALPDSPAVTLTAGKAVSYAISVHNTGAAPEDIFLDPRLAKLATYTLQPQNTVSGITLPMRDNANPPEWIVPTMTHSVTASATAPAPVMFDFGPYPGDPDETSSSGVAAAARLPLGHAVTPLTQGLWFAVPSEVGPFGSGAAPSLSMSMSMKATTQEFDMTASSAVGDFWRFAVQPLAASATYNLFTINPGQTRTITLTVQPSGAAGTVVRGILYIDDFVDSMQFLSGSQLVALPYAYTVG